MQLVPPHGKRHQTKVKFATTPFASTGASWSLWKKLRAHHQTFRNVCNVWTYGCTANRVNVFKIAVALPGRSELSLAAATPCRLQLCAVSGSSAGNLAALNWTNFSCIVTRNMRSQAPTASRHTDGSNLFLCLKYWHQCHLWHQQKYHLTPETTSLFQPICKSPTKQYFLYVRHNIVVTVCHTA
jgi:hypothetical protein